jgi:hypothetical protein
MLSEALRTAAAPRAIIAISCGPALDCKELFGGGGSVSPELPTPNAATGGEAGRVAPSSPVYLFADADRLSDEQIKDLLEAAQAVPPDPHVLGAGVLSAHSSFPARFEGLAQHILKEGFAAGLRVQHLDRDEVEAFICFQLPPGEGANLFTAQRVALIAIASGGDPAVVSRLARRMLGASVANGETPPPKRTPRRYWASLRLSAGIIACLGVFWLIVIAFGPQDLGALGSFLRDLIVPQIDGSAPSRDVPATATTPLPPEAAEGSSSVAVAAKPPGVAPPSDVAVEPAAVNTERQGAAPPSDVAAEPAAVNTERQGVGRSSGPASNPVRLPPAGGRLSAAEIAALVARGDAFLGAGDIASARLYFQRAADAGDARAAMRIAVTFDAAFLDRAGLQGLRGDPDQAAFWYRRARDLGEVKPERETAPSAQTPSQPR